MKYIVNDQVVFSQPPEGPLAAHIESFAQWASEQGYTLYSVYRRVLLTGCFSRWLGAGRQFGYLYSQLLNHAVGDGGFPVICCWLMPVGYQ